MHADWHLENSRSAHLKDSPLKRKTRIEAGFQRATIIPPGELRLVLRLREAEDAAGPRSPPVGPKGLVSSARFSSGSANEWPGGSRISLCWTRSDPSNGQHRSDCRCWHWRIGCQRRPDRSHPRSPLHRRWRAANAVQHHLSARAHLSDLGPVPAQRRGEHGFVHRASVGTEVVNSSWLRITSPLSTSATPSWFL